MRTIKVFPLFCLCAFFFFVSCKKEKELVTHDGIIGTWVSTDKSETLTFVDEDNAYRNSDHYDYQLNNDSIKMGYSGELYIYVVPTTHKYYLDGNTLTIDFSNKRCYGFDLKLKNYTRK